MNRDLKFLLNSLKCPICSAQIDIISCGSGANYGCVNNTSHYVLKILDEEFPYTKIFKEKIKFTKNSKLYIIEQIYGENISNIWIYSVDLENRIIESRKRKYKIINFKLFDFQNFDIGKAINRVNNVFLM